MIKKISFEIGAILLIIYFAIPCMLLAHKTHHKKDEKSKIEIPQTTKNIFYTCPMHKEIKMDKPGNCPICGMNLKMETDILSIETKIKKDQEGESRSKALQKYKTAQFKELPTLHPLIVHFPIVLLIFSAIYQLFSFFIFKKKLSVIVLFTLILGFIIALISAKIFHPHTVKEISEKAKFILEKHEQYANYALWLSGIAILIKFASHFIFKRKLILEIILLFFMLVLTYSVIVCGHRGGQLVHIESVGPKGKFLEIENIGQ